MKQRRMGFEGFDPFAARISRNLDEATASSEEENRIRAKLQGELRNLSSDLDHVREQLEEEQEARAELQRALTKSNNDVVAWKQKCESGEGGVR